MRLKAVLALVAAVSFWGMAEETPICGEAVIGCDAITAFVSVVNPDFNPAIAKAFYEIAPKYGIRADIAVCQSVIETGWFRFSDGTAVTPDQHNYCGLGVTRLGVRGAGFDTIEDGVTAQMQHLYAYACSLPLPRGERLVDPRFGHVRRSIAPTWEKLSGKWAMNSNYGTSIMSLYQKALAFSGVNETVVLPLPEADCTDSQTIHDFFD